MIGISVQMSLYPLGQDNIDPAIQAVLDTLDEHGLAYEVGAMSTTLWGEDQAVWAALQDAFRRAAAHGAAVMQVTVSNACPLPTGRSAPAGEE
jgi:uncharacterized protein YqgV (UPF0045/DUF77 family)